MVAIQNSANTGGILGALGSTGDGSVSSFLGQSSASANNFALISQNSVTNASSFLRADRGAESTSSGSQTATAESR